jgi:hypothetical protein
MQSLYEMIFGTANTTNNLTSPATQQAVQQAFTSGYSAYQQARTAGQFGSNAGLANQMAQQQYNSLLGQAAQQYNPRPDWVFAGTPCRDAVDFADRMWPEDCAEKTFFVLKYAGKTASPGA